MSRMNQVMQIGTIEGDIHYYIEDYAYTYLKKQKDKEKTKYFLYGEKEENNKQKKLYIYGITEKPKMEQTYFKDYYPLGFLKINRDGNYWINLKGQEQKISGFYVFYSPNQAMQEYLVDHQKEEKTDKPEDKTKRQLDREVLPMKETLIPVRKPKRKKKDSGFKNEKFIFPIGGIIAACLILLVLTSSNGQKKVEIFRQVIAQTMSGIITEPIKENFVIEEKNAGQKEMEVEKNPEEDISYTEKKENGEQNDVKQEVKVENDKNKDNNAEVQSAGQAGNSLEVMTTGQEKEISENLTLEEEVQGEIVSTEEDIGTTSSTSESNYEEYVVKNGDTLVAICKTKYGSLVKMKEICTINNIKNADYIAPGQKIYLP